MRKLFQFIFSVVVAVVIIDALYPETHLIQRIREWLAKAGLGPQPEPPDVQ